MKKNEWRREISKPAANNRQKAKRANASQKKDGAFAARRYEQGKTTQVIFFEISTSRNGMDTHGNAVWATYISIASGLSNQLGHFSGSTWFEQEGGDAHIHGSSKILELPVSSGTWGFKTQTDVDLISMLLRKQGSEDTNLLYIYTYISACLYRPLPICQRKEEGWFLWAQEDGKVRIKMEKYGRPLSHAEKKREEEAISYEGKNKEGLSQSGETQGVWSRFIQSCSNQENWRSLDESGYEMRFLIDIYIKENGGWQCSLRAYKSAEKSIRMWKHLQKMIEPVFLILGSERCWKSLEESGFVYECD